MTVCNLLTSQQADLPVGWTRGGSHPSRYEMGLDEGKCGSSNGTASAFIRSTCMIRFRGLLPF